MAEGVAKRSLIIESSAPQLIVPRVAQASLPPIVLPSGQLECPACGGSFDSWQRYYSHIIAENNKVCAWIQIRNIDLVPSRPLTPREDLLSISAITSKASTNGHSTSKDGIQTP